MSSSQKLLKKRRSFIVGVIFAILVALNLNTEFLDKYFVNESNSFNESSVLSDQNNNETGEYAKIVLNTLQVKGRASKTDYTRSQFSDGWANIGNCDVRNLILAREMTELKLAEGGCIVLSGTLNDMYTGKIIYFVRGSTTSSDVQIDHVVALSDAWQKGAQNLDVITRLRFSNDPLNLMPVDGPANQEKGDSDAASWLPLNKSYRCRYVARQIAVKSKYSLWVTSAEKSAMTRVLNGCGEQRVPVEN